VKVCVTGATGFLGAHLTAKLVEAGHDVLVTVRDPARLDALAGLEVATAKADVLDRAAMQQALEGCELLFHAAGLVGSRPRRELWRTNAVAPRIAVEAAADAGVRRVIVTSSVGAIGPARGGRPATEREPYPVGGTGVIYPDSKHEGEQAAFAAGERGGVEVVAVNPSYVLGTSFNRLLPGTTSTRIVANYLRGRLPAIVDSYMNIVDVEDVAVGHLLAAEKGRSGERYILGGENMRWTEVIERVAAASRVHHPLLVLPAELGNAAELAHRLRLPIWMVEGVRVMAPEWRYSSAKAKRRLGYRPRGARETIERTVEWCMELIEDDRLPVSHNAFDWVGRGLRVAERMHLLAPLRAAGQLTGRKFVMT
jgi:dihydroflavonol-4-reductase